VTLASGQRIPCSVMAQNSNYYVISRYGELRALEKSEVTAVKWKNPTEAQSLGTGDQILTKTGVVLHGAILDQQQGRYFIIQVGAFKHTVWSSQIQSVHKAGQPFAFGP
jgi:hypothetical protein